MKKKFLSMLVVLSMLFAMLVTVSVGAEETLQDNVVTRTVFEKTIAELTNTVGESNTVLSNEEGTWTASFANNVGKVVTESGKTYFEWADIGSGARINLTGPAVYFASGSPMSVLFQRKSLNKDLICSGINLHPFLLHF